MMDYRKQLHRLMGHVERKGGMPGSVVGNVARLSVRWGVEL
jgi:hypothetical protein